MLKNRKKVIVLFLLRIFFWIATILCNDVYLIHTFPRQYFCGIKIKLGHTGDHMVPTVNALSLVLVRPWAPLLRVIPHLSVSLSLNVLSSPSYQLSNKRKIVPKISSKQVGSKSLSLRNNKHCNVKICQSHQCK